MKPDYPPLDPGHDSKRATVRTVGLVLLVVGTVCSLTGLGLFLSNFFTFGIQMGRAVVGIVMFAGGGMMAVVGLQLTMLGNLGTIARYLAGEQLPVARDVARHAAPTVGEFAREVARSTAEGWQEGAGLPEPDAKVRHDCGTWNDPSDRFCKGCGAPLEGLVCPSCRAVNDQDARYCDACGTVLA